MKKAVPHSKTAGLSVSRAAEALLQRFLSLRSRPTWSLARPRALGTAGTGRRLPDLRPALLPVRGGRGTAPRSPASRSGGIGARAAGRHGDGGPRPGIPPARIPLTADRAR